MNKKIVFFRYLPLTQKVKNDFYMSEMASWGYVVEYWDITSLFFQSVDGLESYEPSSEDRITVIRVDSRKDFVCLVKQNIEALYISIMSFEPKLIWIFRVFRKHNCKTSVFSYMPLPLAQGVSLSIKKVFDIKRLWNGITGRAAIWMSLVTGYIRPYDYIFKGGNYGWMGIGYLTPNRLKRSRFFEVNNWDYDKFINANLRIENKPYAVFLDEYYPFHPDLYIFGDKSVNADTYYSDLDRAFSAIENYYGIPVVIAAHPKALKYKDNNYFHGRDVIFNSTLSLVSKASIVLAHDSLSIGFAIMCKKPLVFINSYEIKSKIPESGSFIDNLSRYFHSPVIMADDIKLSVLSETTELSKEVERIYDNMIEDYMSTIKEPTPNNTLLKSYLTDIFPINN